MNNKYIIEYIDQYKDKEPWSLDLVNYNQLKEIGNRCIIRDNYNDINNVFNLGSEPVNIFWQTYLDRVDIVIPTKDIADVKSLSVIKELEKNGQCTKTIVEATFSWTKWFAYHVNKWAKLNRWLGKYILVLNDDIELDYYDVEKMKKLFVWNVWLVWAKCSETPWGVNGSMFMIERRLFEDIGWLNEDYFFMWEDNDLIENVKRRGYDIVIADTYSKHEWNRSMDTSSSLWKNNFEKWKNIFNKKWSNDRRLIWTMILWDENDRYLQEVIPDLFERDLIDRLIVVFDRSNEETVKEVEAFKSMYDIKTYYHDFKLFWTDEWKLRQRTTSYAINENPYWILPIDWDEMLDLYLTRELIYELLEEWVWIDFKIAHFWWEGWNVRVDNPYAAQKNIRLFKYIPENGFAFYDRNIHCWSAPIYAYENRKNSWLILYHFGYIKEKDLKLKIEREAIHDKDTKENPKFVKWLIEEPILQKFEELTFLKTWRE